MPTHSSGTAAPATIVAAAASPLTLVIPPSSEPLNLIITSAASITVVGQSLKPVEVQHVP